MGGLLGNFGLYVMQLKDSVSSAKNSAARATLQGKLEKLVDAKLLLCSAFLTDVLAEAKKFSLLTQEKNVNVVECCGINKIQLRATPEKIQDSNGYILTLSNFKSIFNAVESQEDEDGKPL